MKKMMIGSALTLSIVATLPVIALDFSTATGMDIVKENASKEQGYSSAQKKELMQRLDGKSMTFESGKLVSASKSSFGNDVNVMVSFSAPGKPYPSFTVNGSVTDAESQKIVLAMDEGSAVKSLSGTVGGSGIMGFELKNVKIVPAVMPSFDKGYDPATVTGTDIVKLNAAKEQGFSSAQKKALMKDLEGKVMTFENGKFISISKSSFDKSVNIMANFSAPGKSYPSFTVNGSVTDPAMQKLVTSLDEGSTIKSLTGKVGGSGVLGFELKDVKVVPAK